jgi:hypothetical protein
MTGLRVWRRRTALPFMLGVAAFLTSGCARPPVFTPASTNTLPDPSPGEVESVLFLVGDPGIAHEGTSPLLQTLRADIESWSDRLQRDSVVAVMMLGDLVYPRGMSTPGEATYDNDTSVIMSQVRLVSGPSALQHGARLYFMAGNHDWGLKADREGFIRLVNLETFLGAARTATGAWAYFYPQAGTGGPAVIDWGRYFRILILDTAWWILSSDGPERAAVLAGVEQAFATSGDRDLLMMAHHPYRSGGPHGGGFSVWEMLGARYVLFRAGALLQDITSLPYRALDNGLRELFAREKTPFAFIGGHEHSLQILDGVEETDPKINIVSGSASKTSPLGGADGLRFGQSAPGYMRFVIENDGGVILYVEAGPPEFTECPAAEPQHTTCMSEGMAAFRTVYTQRLR